MSASASRVWTISGSPVVRDAAGAWVEDADNPNWSSYHRTVRCTFPEVLRPRVVLLVPHHCPVHINQLNPEERASYAGICLTTVRATEAEGLAALEVGQNYVATDFADLMHFAPSGGAKLARQVAAKVRERAQALGYLP